MIRYDRQSRRDSPVEVANRIEPIEDKLNLLLTKNRESLNQGVIVALALRGASILWVKFLWLRIGLSPTATWNWVNFLIDLFPIAPSWAHCDLGRPGSCGTPSIGYDRRLFSSLHSRGCGGCCRLRSYFCRRSRR